MRLEPDRYANVFSAETARVAEAVAGLDPARAVLSCPEWTVRDLVTHVGTGHRLAADAVRQRASTPFAYELMPCPEDPAEWTGWLMAGTEELVAAVDDVGFNTPVWTWRPDDHTAGFWVRKMLHDEVIHRYDADLTRAGGGDPPFEVSPELALDGIDDWLTTVATLAPTGRKFAGLVGDGQSLHLHATDADGEWIVRREADAVRWETGHSKADVAVRGPVVDLLLVLNRRRGPERLEVLGDQALFDHWLAHSQF